MKRLICLIKGHRPYWWPAEHIGNVYGPGLRECGRCGTILTGNTPQVGDRWKQT